jgi:hypothetical protein
VLVILADSAGKDLADEACFPATRPPGEQLLGAPYQGSGTGEGRGEPACEVRAGRGHGDHPFNDGPIIDGPLSVRHRGVPSSVLLTGKPAWVV